MSFHSHSNTPSVISSPVATSPKYSMSGITNEINRARSQNGYLSTLFGRSTYGTADRTSNMYRSSQPLADGNKKVTGSISKNRLPALNQLGISVNNSQPAQKWKTGTVQQGAPKGVAKFSNIF